MMKDLFKPAKNEPKDRIDTHIIGMKEMLSRYQTDLREIESKLLQKEHMSPEQKNTYMFNFPDYPEKKLCKGDFEVKIKAQEQRIATLEKIKKNEPITKEEHSFLLIITNFTSIDGIYNYKNISSSSLVFN